MSKYMLKSFQFSNYLFPSRHLKYGIFHSISQLMDCSFSACTVHMAKMISEWPGFKKEFLIAKQMQAKEPSTQGHYCL